jgi:hypothetical protein
MWNCFYGGIQILITSATQDTHSAVKWGIKVTKATRTLTWVIHSSSPKSTVTLHYGYTLPPNRFKSCANK